MSDNLYNLIQNASTKNLINETEKEALLNEYGSLVDDQQRLAALDSAGVDNWSGYGYAMEMLEEWNNE